MSLKPILPTKMTRQSQSAQLTRGSALVVALFIIVVMALIGSGLVRIVSDASQSVVSDIIGHRATNAARSGTEQLLVELFPHNATVNLALCPLRSTVASDDPSSGGNGTNYSFNQQGLLGCSATVYCDHALVDTTTHVRILAQGSCTVDGMIYSKEILLEASDVAL